MMNGRPLCDASHSSGHTSSGRMVSEHTAIVTDELLHIEYPHCVLPPHFFERVLYLKRKAATAKTLHQMRKVLSVQTRDGRDVMSVLSE